MLMRAGICVRRRESTERHGAEHRQEGEREHEKRLRVFARRRTHARNHELTNEVMAVVVVVAG